MDKETLKSGAFVTKNQEIDIHGHKILNKERVNLKKSLINNYAKEILYNSTAQAIIRMCQTRHSIMRLFLVTCLSLAIALSSYLVSMTLSSYFKYEVFTTTKNFI